MPESFHTISPRSANLWKTRKSGGGYLGVTPMMAGGSYNVSTVFGGRSYYSALYLSEAIGSANNTVAVTIPTGSKADYFIVTPFHQANVNDNTKWEDTGKIAKELAPGTNTVTVGTNNRFAVLAVNYTDPVAAGETFSYTTNNIAATETYVKSTDSDTTDLGTEQSPYATVGKAVSSLASGGTVYILDAVDMAATVEIPVGQTVTITSKNGSHSLARADAHKGTLLDVEGTLTLTDIILDGDGVANVTAPLADVYSSGTLTLGQGSVLTGNHNTTTVGGGVHNGGTLVLDGGKITGNQAGLGRGAGVYTIGTFTVKGGMVGTYAGDNGMHRAGGGSCIIDAGGLAPGTIIYIEGLDGNTQPSAGFIVAFKYGFVTDEDAAAFRWYDGTNLFTGVSNGNNVVMAAPVPTLAATPAQLDFGQQQVATTSAKQNITVTAVNLTGNISYNAPNGFAVTKAAGWSDTTGGTLEVAFAPTAAQPYTGALTIQSPGAPDQVVTLRGEGTAAPQPGDAAITPASATFDKNSAGSQYRDIAVTLSPGSHTLQSVAMDGVTLSPGADYTVSGSAYTFPASYLATLADGAHTVTFQMSGGQNPTLSLNVTDTTVSPPPVTGNPSAAVTDSLNLDLNGRRTGSIAVSLGQSGAGSFAVRAEVISGNSGVATASPAQLTADGSVTVEAVVVGSTDITVRFYDAAGNSLGSFGGPFPVNVVNSYTPGNTGRSSSGSGGSSQTDMVRSALPSGPHWHTGAEIKAAVAAAKQNDKSSAILRYVGSHGVRAAQWKLLGDLSLRADTMDGNAVQVRVSIPEPGKLTKDVLLTGSIKGSAVDSREAFFEKWFANKVRIVHLEQQGEWGQPVEVAAKVDLIGMDADNLYFYSYDKKANTYKRIQTPAYWIDKNGYLHFTTECGGDIIISEGKLERK